MERDIIAETINPRSMDSFRRLQRGTFPEERFNSQFDAGGALCFNNFIMKRLERAWKKGVNLDLRMSVWR